MAEASSSEGQGGWEGLPEDPLHPFYLTFCFACSSKAKPNQEFIRNYGGVVCFSCRAFFRRVHQKSLTPRLTCKKGGRCNVVVKNRRKCPKCRLDRCLATGMNRAAILTNEQKRHRFRKMLQKRQQQGPHPEPDPGLPGTQWQEEEGRMRPGPSTAPTSSKEAADAFIECLSHKLNASIRCEASVFLLRKATIKGQKGEEGWNKRVSDKAKRIVKAYQDTVGRLNCPLLQKLRLLKRKRGSLTGPTGLTEHIDRTDVTSFIAAVSEQYRHFAERLRSFTRLDPTDQSVLFARNNPLFVQFHIIILLLIPLEESNIFSTGGFSARKFKKSWLKHYHFNVFLEKFNTSARLFKTESDLDFYGRLVEKIRHLCLTKNITERSILAYLILFDHDQATSLRYEQDLDELYVEGILLFESLIKPRFPTCRSLSFLTDNLTKMALFCSYNINWAEEVFVSQECFEDQDPRASGIVMPYTDVEERWLQKQIIHMDEAHRSVIVGGDFVGHFFMHIFGKPTPRTFFPTYLSAAMERLWRTLTIHPEFQELPPNLKMRIMRFNGPIGMAMVTVRGENSTGIQQVQNGFGELDELVWKEKYASQLKDVEHIKHVSICNTPFLSDEEKMNYKELIRDSAILNQDPVLFRLNVLLCMTRPCPGVPAAFSQKVHDRYVVLLKRRLSHLHAVGRSPFSNMFLTSDEAFSTIMSRHQNLNHIAGHILHMFSKAQVKMPFGIQ